jgi:glycine/D-amino acid oxidase-like deaminating enzyme
VSRMTGDADAPSLEPWWWRKAPLSGERAAPVPARADVAIVGAGITGCVAAAHLARGGRQVVVLDSHEPGHGGATRNAGYVGRSLKHTLGEMIARDGPDHAVRAYRELGNAFDAVADTVAEFGIDCHYRRQGRLLLATSAAMHDQMVREYALRERHLGERFAVVDRAAQRGEVATDHYFGGLRIDDHAGLHPGLYHKGLLQAARAAGATICGHSPVHGIRRAGDGFELALEHAHLAARDVIVATNGYSGDAWPWLKRRLVPFDAYQAVSAPLGEERVRALLPGDRTFIDWNFDVDWFRRAPDDGSRIVFGGLTGGRGRDLHTMARLLRGRMLRIFPDLHELRIANVWTGRCAGTFDAEPRIGRHDGIHYAAGYCFIGVPIGTHFGRLLARRVLGTPDGESAFDRPLRTIPLYRGDPWWLPAAFRWMRRHDR